MAVLSDNDRVAIHAEMMREIPGAINITKADLRAALNAADAWVDSNAASYNLALPQPARGQLTSKQKAWIMAIVLQRRFGVEAG